MRRFLTAALLLLPLCFAFADVPQTIAQADALHDQGKYLEARTMLLAAAGGASPQEQAELYWRTARETLELGDIAEKEKKPQAEVLALFVEGEGYADKAITADAKNDLGYYWKSSNIGRWGQVKGILNSLFKAGPMRDLLVKELSINAERSDAYYVLGQLYRELPGVISFGNVDSAVSLGRKAVDLRDAQVKSGVEKEIVYNFSTELAKTLWKRNWTAATRATESKSKASRTASASTPLEKGSVYEASAAIPSVSDREEAKALVQWVIAELEKIGNRTAAQAKDLQKARDLLKSW
jgi:hypothetical protein